MLFERPTNHDDKREVVNHLFKFVSHLKSRRLGTDQAGGLQTKIWNETDFTNLNSWNIEHELNIFYNYYFARLLCLKSTYPNVMLYITPEMAEENKVNQLNEFLLETNFMRSRFDAIRELYHFSHNLLPERIAVLDNIDYPEKSISVLESAHKRIMELMNSAETNLDEIQSLINIERIFPLANYYKTKKASEIMPRYCQFICISGNQGFQNCFTFLDNYKFMTRATRILGEEMSLLVQYMIYYEFILNDNQKRIQQNLINYFLNSFITYGQNYKISKDIQKTVGKYSAGKSLFKKDLIHYANLYKIEEIILEDDSTKEYLILTFPLSKTTFSVPINFKIDHFEYFSKYGFDKCDQEGVEFKINYYVTYNDIDSSNDPNQRPVQINSNTWQKELSIGTFDAVKKAKTMDDFEQLNTMDAFNNVLTGLEKMRLDITKQNVWYNINVDLKTKVGVLAVQYSRREVQTNDFVNTSELEYYDFYDGEFTDILKDRPQIQLLKLTDKFHFCFEHHFKVNKQQLFIWTIQNIKLNKNNKFYEIDINETKFTNDFWISTKNGLKFDKVCISFVSERGKDATEFEKIFTSDEYIHIFHGVIDNFDNLKSESKKIKLIVKIYPKEDIHLLDMCLQQNNKFNMEIYSTEYRF